MKRLSIMLLALAWSVVVALPAAGQPLAGTVQSALEYNRTHQGSTWVNPDSGLGETVTPVRTFAGAAGQPCREFVTTITIAGRSEQGYGTACRQPDGSWHLAAGNRGASVVRTVPPQVIYAPAVPPRVVYRRYYYDPWYDPWGYPWGVGYYPPISLSFGWFHYGGHRGHHPVYRGHRGHYRGTWSHRGHHRGDWGHRGHHRSGGGHRRHR
jgi:hypothetical protein